MGAREVDMGFTSKSRIKFEVELYGDTVCPWSYLGKKSLDSAIETYAAKYPEDVFDIIWKPFILWPTAKVSAYDKRAPVVKMVGPARALGVFERLTTMADEYGIQFNWDGLVGNSADSHKLVMLAYEIDERLRNEQQQQYPRGESSPRTQPSPPPTPDLATSEAQPSPQSPSILNQTQHAFLEALFYTTLTQGFDPSDRSFLISLALSMDPPLATYPHELLAYLDNEESTRKLGLGGAAHADAKTQQQPQPQRDEKHQQQIKQPNHDAAKPAEERGATRDTTNLTKSVKDRSGSSPPQPQQQQQHLINAVPSVIVQGRYRVGGMQKPEVYLRVFEKVRAGQQQHLTTSSS